MATIAQYNDWKNTLQKLLEETINTSATLSPDIAGLYRKLLAQCKEDTLKIQVVGTVKNGKSSFTNAILGESVLPVDDIPCTAVVSEVKYGAQKKAVVKFACPLPLGLIDQIPPATKAYLQKYNMGKDAQGNDIEIPPLEVPYNELNKYVAIPEPSDDVLFDSDKLQAYREMIDQQSPYEVAELLYPSEILREGVEIVDSPGLNESSRRTEVTLDYLRKADAAIFLLNATTPVTEEEREVIEEILLPLGFKDLLMVANRFDMVEHKDRLKRYVKASVMEYTSNKEVFFVSAKEALKGLSEHDSTKLNESGMPEFIAFLSDYLARRKGQLKIKKTAIQLKNSIADNLLKSVIPAKRAALNADSRDLNDRLNKVLPKLREIEARKKNIINRLEHEIPVALVAIKEYLTAFFNELQGLVPAWIKEFEPKADFIIASKKNIQDVQAQLLNHVKEETKRAYDKWNNDTFQCIMQEQSQNVFGDLKEDIESLVKDIVEVEDILTGLSPEVRVVSATERVVGLTAMLFLPMGGAGADTLAGGFELGNFLKNFAIDLGVGFGVGLVAFAIFPPAGILAALIWSIVKYFQGKKRVIDTTKEKLIEEINKNMSHKIPEMIAETVGKVREAFDGIKDSLVSGLDVQINTLQEQIEEIKRFIAKGQGEINAKLDELSKSEQKLMGISAGLESLTQTVDHA